MKRLPITAIAILVVLSTMFATVRPGGADQADSRLDALFVRLLEAPGPGEAQRIEGLIWQIWAQSDDGAVRGLMEAGVDAMSRGDYRHALSKFDQMVLIAPDFAEAWNKRATAWFIVGDMRKSLADCDEVMKRNPQHFGALSGYGQIYINLEEHEKAIEYFKRALAVNPNLTELETVIQRLEGIVREKYRRMI
jgi:tetratricopeptide (TPR) repeat protein